jgi:hypothetical protein
MNYKRLILVPVLLAATLVLVLSRGSTLGAPAPTSLGESSRMLDAPANPGQTHVALQGTAWVPQNASQFSLWQPQPWGIEAKRKATAPAKQWVFVGLPLIPFLGGVAQKVQYVEFCAKSSNGAASKPLLMQLNEQDLVLVQTPVTWPADNLYHCFGYDFGAGAIWRSTLGLGVQFQFAKATDKITLYKAWVALTE